MTGFTEKNGILHADDVPLPEIARDYGTPCYVYSASAIRKQYTDLRDAMARVLPADRQPLICYACKTNSNIAILKLLRNSGSSLEIVSEGELFRGLKAGFTGDKIISNSFGKNEGEIRACLKAGILQFNIEVSDELNTINTAAIEMGKTADVLFRLNPNISAGGHSKISTGRKDDKFGNTAEDILGFYSRAEDMSNINPIGISIHIGSQVTQAETFKPGFEKVAELVRTLRERGHTVTRTDIGGGLSIIYNDEKPFDLNSYATYVRDIILPLDTEIQMEPGRYIAGNGGVLLTKAEYIKATPSQNFIVLDAGMSDMIRPTLYDAYHGVRPVLQHNETETETYDVVGQICESSDFFAKGREINRVMQGDLMIIQSVGAHGYVMASNFNSRPLPAEILVDGDKVAVINKAQTLDDLVARETIPAWL